ncbi:MAG TPA: bifunctional diaminohydroxyphosphoribosylaminopyrimidine deaminase/5-amino-6-(5-phosphoribosylamino)uracil reductase RibD [Terriglobales bacterium]|nr:bifunctional diaminohydroxyphosphoribosylaminopyrimidine deaminase/5-amino-6-(5-phosphoribosylamino)uracil reductase RibD [Terriglobales bacterium]
MSVTDDRRFMRRALQLARRGVGYTSPNPPVGAVIVRRGQIIAEGYHRRAGAAHGEAEALANAGDRARGATLYVTLEPCAHHGRTPPCVDAVLAAGVKRVVIGSIDPNPRVAGGGAQRLLAAGLSVTTGMLQDAGDELLAPFRKHVTTGRPFVTLKLAASIDGRIATKTGESRWISSEASRRYVHRLRAEHDAVLVGAATVIADDPELTCRLRGGRNPLRVILDGRLRVPASAKVLQGPPPTWIITDKAAARARMERLAAAGAELIRLPGRQGEVGLDAVVAALGQRGVMSLLVEGGGTVAAAALRAGVVDRLLLFLAPKLIGGDGRPMLGALGVEQVADALSLRDLKLRRFSEDLLLDTRLNHEAL